MNQMLKDRFRTKCEWMYYLILFAYLSLLFINQTELRIMLPPALLKLLQLMRYTCYALLALKIVCVPLYQKKFLITALSVCGCVALCVLSSTRRGILFSALAVIAAYDCDDRRILKTATAAFSIGLAVTLLFCLTGIFENRILDAGRNRFNLGFNWVTLAPIYFFFISIGYANWRGERIMVSELLLMEVISFLLYKATDTRMTFVLNSLFLFIIAVQKIVFKNEWHIIHSAGMWVCILPLLFCLGVLLIQAMYSPGEKIWDMLNSLLSGRLSLADGNLKELPITMFGQAIEWKGFSLGEGLLEITKDYQYNNVDCSYLRILFDYGIVGLLITLGLYTIGMYKAVKAQDPLLLWSYIVVLLFCLTEQWMIELSFNPFILLAAGNLKPRERQVKQKRIIFRQA